ncbi:hypothetical protein DUNSADRAFT_6779 [Dunaliella salina]|uniref:RING-type E3 ubiquitin transferase n=1 Tax=Dunaliella salina TaxID=3046 RepID=A0ABQ7H6P8_DUNSA|nr:hypothetical protein DUNSADRAFT_6779 [Dunaliella salina]|eukprot:KAF5842535.1 hypothetical protein DUNSADRAFT_6779 [Dunaliella salina]
MGEQPESSLRSYLSLPGIAALGAGCILYTYSTCVTRRAQELSMAEPISQLADLSKVAQLLPMLVAIRGRVNSYYAKKCELSEKHAVIHELLEEEIWRKQRAEGRTIYEPFETRKVFEECEWFVEDGSGLRVKVENALQAGHLRSAMEMKTEFAAEDLTQKSIGRVLMEKAWQMTKTGMRKTERYLPVGTVVTCVGELSPNHVRTPVSATPAGTIGPSGTHDQTKTTYTTAPLHLPSATTSGGSSSPGSRGSSEGAVGPGASTSSSSGGGFGSYFQSGSSGGSNPSAQGGGEKSVFSGPFPGLLSGQGDGRGGGGGGEESLAYVLRKPVVGPSYITTLSVDQLVAAMSNTARKCRWAAYALGAVGVVLVARKAILKLQQQLHQRRVRARVMQVEQARRTRQTKVPGGFHNPSAREDPRQEGYPEGYQGDREPNTCVICLESNVGTVFTPCGHMCCCVGCGLATSMERCPICRVRGRAIRVYRP